MVQKPEDLLEARATLLSAQRFLPPFNPGQTFRALRRAENAFAKAGMPTEACACKAAVSRSLYDLGRERDALDAAASAIADPCISAADLASVYSTIALCLAHLGELDRSLWVASELAVPAARACGEPGIAANALRSQALAHLQILIQRTAPTLWRGVQSLPVTTPAPDPSTILSILQSATEALSTKEPSGYISMARQVTLGLMGSRHGPVKMLEGISSVSAGVDPLQAGWAHYCRAIVLCWHSAEQEAMAALHDALTPAVLAGGLGLVRDVKLQQSRIHEAMGDYRKAFYAYKDFAQLCTVSLSESTTDKKRQLGLKEMSPAEALSGSQFADESRRDLEPVHVRRAIRFIDENLTNGISISAVAEYCNISRRTLEIYFKQTRGCTVGHHIRHQQLHLAATALRLTAASINEISLSAGYHSISAFSHAFRTQFGVPPAVWRKQNGGPQAE